MERLVPNRQVKTTYKHQLDNNLDLILARLKSLDAQNCAIIQNQSHILNEIDSLRKAVNNLSSQQRRVAQAIATGDIERSKPVDFETLKQHYHAYGKD